jgi:hypothetical protein
MKAVRQLVLALAFLYSPNCYSQKIEGLSIGFQVAPYHYWTENGGDLLNMYDEDRWAPWYGREYEEPWGYYNQALFNSNLYLKNGYNIQLNFAGTEFGDLFSSYDFQFTKSLNRYLDIGFSAQRNQYVFGFAPPQLNQPDFSEFNGPYFQHFDNLPFDRIYNLAIGLRKSIFERLFIHFQVYGGYGNLYFEHNMVRRFFFDNRSFQRFFTEGQFESKPFFQIQPQLKIAIVLFEVMGEQINLQAHARYLQQNKKLTYTEIAYLNFEDNAVASASVKDEGILKRYDVGIGLAWGIPIPRI